MKRLAALPHLLAACRGVFLLLLAAALFAGCTTLSDARQARGQGTSRTYAADFDTVWRTIPHALTALGLQVVSADAAEGCVLAQRGMTMDSYGENIAVFAARAGDHATCVEAVSKRVLQTNITATDWEPRIHQQLERALAAPPLPATPPPVQPLLPVPPALPPVAPPPDPPVI